MAMDLNAKAAYIRGMMKGMEFDPTTQEGKIIVAMMDLLEEMADVVSEHDDALDQAFDELDAIDEDMDDLVDSIFGDDDEDEDEDEDDSDEDEEDEEEEEEELTGEALAEMDFEELEDVCDDKDLDTDPDDFDEEDIEKLRKAIAKELGIKLPAKKEAKGKGKKGKK